MHWSRLKPGRFGMSAAMAGVDPNFIWADATGFRDFLRPGEASPNRVPALVELKDEQNCMARFLAELRHRRGGVVPAAYRGRTNLRYATAWLDADYCRQVVKGRAGRMIERFELQRSVVPQRPLPKFAPARAAPEGATHPARALAGEYLVGVIDTGCTFAHARLRDESVRGTRVLSIWDQDEHPAFTRSGFAGGVPAALGYGREAGRALLNRIMGACSSGRAVDETACYELADYHQLRRRFNHGAAVLDLMAGSLRLGTRMAKTPGGQPTWVQSPREPAAAADLVFVQLPGDAVQDSSSAGLPRLVLDGLRYILGSAGPATRRIVINLSDGSSRGTHDGQSIIEKAMAALVAEQAEEFPQRTVEIVVAAGNSFDEERHAQFDSLRRGVEHALWLRLPPGCESPAALTIVLPQHASDVQVCLVPPLAGQDTRHWVGPGQACAWPSASQAACGVSYPAVHDGRNHRVLLTFAPTLSLDGALRPAPSGDWRIVLRSNSGVDKPVHFYISRNQQNAGALRRAQQARFVDVDGRYDPQRHLRALEKDRSDPPRSDVRRSGTLNGLGTLAPGQGVYTIGSYRWQDRMLSKYSSAGPAVESGPVVRAGPDAYGATDLSRDAPGIPVTGTLSGTCVRAIGTSFAAPQAARGLLNREVGSGSATRGAGVVPRAPPLPKQKYDGNYLIDP